jgi:hypothetical protein
MDPQKLRVRVSIVTVVLTCSVILCGEIHVVIWETAWTVQSHGKDIVRYDLSHVTSLCICERKLQTFVQPIFTKMSGV